MLSLLNKLIVLASLFIGSFAFGMSCENTLKLFVNSNVQQKEQLRHDTVFAFTKMNQFMRTLYMYYYTGFKNFNIQQVIQGNEDTIEHIADILLRRGIEFDFETRTMQISDKVTLVYDVIRLDPSVQQKLTSLEATGRFARLAGVENVYIDFIGNGLRSAGGFYFPGDHSVNLSSDSVISLFGRNVVDNTTYHEMMHAMFARMRQIGKDSIYHMSWQVAQGRKKVTRSAKYYQQYMSAEEVYNFINGFYWNIPNDFVSANLNVQKAFLEEYDSWFKMVSSITAEGAELAGSNLRSLNRMLAKKEKLHFMKDWYFVGTPGNDLRIIYEGKNNVIVKTYSQYAEYAYRATMAIDALEKKYGFQVLTENGFRLGNVPREHRPAVEELLGVLTQIENAMAQEQYEKSYHISKVCLYYMTHLQEIEREFRVLKRAVDHYDSLVKPNRISERNLREAYRQFRLKAKAFVEYSREATNKYQEMISSPLL